jgi:peptidoglycan/xylan/chitin deacetylase (PgdA/CDA1 family)
VTFAALRAELDRWPALPRRATLWWRDDDACRATPALARLLDVSASHRVPVAIAAIPARLSGDLVEALIDMPSCTLLQHGYEHRNHAVPGERSCELDAHRPVAVCIAELVRGRERLEAAFGARFLPVLVPPWNRIAPEVVDALAQARYRGLSTFAPRRSTWAVPGVRQCNTHVDPIAWRRGRAFVGRDEAAARLAAHLALRRRSEVDPDEPTGLLTHHLDFDDDAWRFVEDLFDATRTHPAVAWLSAAEAFAAPT